LIRPINNNDIGVITEIYNYYIKYSISTFEEIEISVKEMTKRVDSILLEFPFLVYEINKEILGYAYASKWNKRSAYKFTAESSVYLHQDAVGKGIGTLLYVALIDILRQATYHSVIGGVSLPNAASVALHEKLGYKKAAHYKEVGYKFDKWIDVGYWQLKSIS